MTVQEGWKRGEREVENGWKRGKKRCIMTPMPNHLSTYLSLFYYSSFDEWGRVENTTPKIKKPHKTVRERRAERCGNGADEKDG